MQAGAYGHLRGPIRKFFDAPYRSYKTEENQEFAGNRIAHGRESINEIELRTTKELRVGRGGVLVAPLLSSCPYSPECVEGKFCELGSPPREPRSIILLSVVAEGCAQCEHP